MVSESIGASFQKVGTVKSKLLVAKLFIRSQNIKRKGWVPSPYASYFTRVWKIPEQMH